MPKQVPVWGANRRIRYATGITRPLTSEDCPLHNTYKTEVVNALRRKPTRHTPCEMSQWTPRLLARELPVNQERALGRPQCLCRL